ncbi:MAG: DUF3616 domain-containing protein [Polyangiales bacterium]
MTNPLTGSLLGKVALRFDTNSAYVPEDLSCAARGEAGTLVVAADERSSLELLAPSANPHVYTQVRSLPLHAALGIGEADEVDLEGLAFDATCETLFLCGSHSAKRRKPKGKDEAVDLERLASVKVEPARFVLARARLGQLGTEGAPKLAKLPLEGADALCGVLADDAHLGPYLPLSGRASTPIPGKDNGFDIEGLAVHGERLLLGLRGPVLRGYAFVLELQLAEEGDDLHIVAQGKRRYRKHALDLDGLGVRELIVRGDDVLVLAGPTMTLDGAHRMYRWHGGPSAKRDTLVKQEKGVLEPLFDIPFLPSFDRAEGLARHDWFDEDDSLLVLYDAPSPARRRDEHAVLADVFAI